MDLRRAILVSSIVLSAIPELGFSAEPLTEAEYLAAVPGDHPAIVARAGPTGEARARELTARTIPDPEAEVVREELSPGGSETTVALGWRVPLARGRRIDAAETFSEAAEAEVEVSRLELRLEMRALYADWAMAAERREVIASLSRLSEGIQKRMEDRAHAGEVSGLAARRIRLVTVGIRNELATAEADEAVAGQLALSFLSPAAEHTPVRPELPEAPAPDDAEPRALRLVEARIAQAQAELRLARAELFEPHAIAGWKRVEEDGGGESADGPVIGLGWTLPIFNGSRSSRPSLEHRLAVLRAEQEVVRRRTSAESDGARAAYARLREAALDAESATRDAFVTVEAVDAAFRLEEADVTDLVDTMRSALDGRLSVVDLHEKALAAHRQLEATLGRALPTEGGRR